MRTIRKMQVGISIENDQSDTEKDKKEKDAEQAAVATDAAEAAAVETTEETGEAATATAKEGEETAVAETTPEGETGEVAETTEAGAEAGEVADAAADAAAEAAADATAAAAADGEVTPEEQAAAADAGAEAGAEVAEDITGETGEAAAETGETAPDMSGETLPDSTGGEVTPEATAVDAETMAAEVGGGITPEGTTPTGEDPAAATAAAATATITEVAENGETGNPATELAQQLEDTRTKVEQLAELAAETSTALIEVERLATTLDVEADVIESRTDAADALDDMADFVEDKIEDGGLSQGEAEAVNIAVEQIMNSVRMPAAARKALPSMENFGVHSDKIITSKHSLEAIQINADTLRRALVAAWKRIKELAIKYWNAIFNSVPQMERRATALEEAVKKLKASGGTAMIDNERIAKELSIGNEVPADLTGALRTLNAVMTPIFAQRQDIVEATDGWLKSIANTSFAGIADKFTAQKWAGMQGMEEVGQPENGVATFETGDLIGNFRIYYKGPAEDLRGSAAVRAYREGIRAGVVDSDADGADSVRALNQQSAVSALHEVRNILSLVKSYQAQQTRADKVKADIINIIGRLNPEAMSEEDLDAMRDILTGMQGMVDQPATAVSKRAMSVVKATLDLVDQSLKTADVKDAKPAGALPA